MKNDGIYQAGFPLVEMNTEKFSQLKSEDYYLFIPCPRLDDYFLDYCKVADMVINISTVEYTDLQKMNVKPADSIKAID